MFNLPPITDKQVSDQLELLSNLAESGEITQWIDAELLNLQEENPILYKFVMDRSQRFAHGAVAVGNISAIAISFALEYIVLLRILGTGIETAKGLAQFSSMMETLFKNGKIEGYDELGKDNNE